MNQLFGQSTDAVRSGDGDLGSNSLPARPLPLGGAEQAFFHLDVKRSLQLHWRLARNVAIGGALLAVAYFLVQALVLRSWPAYEADSMVYVQPTPPKVFEPSQGGSPRWPYDTNTYETYIQQQMINVTRDDVLASALKKIGDFQRPGESEQAAAQRLAQSLSVTREGSAYEFSISARAGSAEFAADIANNVTAAYMESIARDQKSGDSQRLTMLRDEKDRIGKALDADRTEQGILNAQLGVASVGSAVPDHYDEDISSTRTELIKARTDHDAAEAKFAALDAGHGPSSAAIDAAAEEMIASDAGLVSMKTSLNQRRATLISQMANLTPSHPQYKQDEVELGKINTELDTMMKDLRAKAAARIQLQLQAELQRTAGVESQVNGQLRRLVGLAGSATPKMQRSSDLAADIARLQTRFATVDEQLHNLMLEDNAPSAAYQVTPAVAPLGRTKSGVLRNVLLIIFAGLVFGVLSAVAAHKLDPKVYIGKDVEMILGFPPMAQLPDFTEVSSGVAEEYLLRLASSIEHARKQSQLRSCVFTGTGAGNGVSLLVNRVGGMLQAMGRPTLLVDASGAPTPENQPRPSASENVPGLVPVERVSRPTALLQQMAEETETQDESLVLTDTAPLPVSAETEYLARFVDCAIVIIESGKTTRRELREAAATLQRLDVAAVGFVLNRVGLEKADPGFRDSVKAIEKHLEAQAGNNAYRAESARRSIATDTLWPEVSPNGQTHSIESSARALFEAELAAAGAAVERFSHPATIEQAACLPSPTVPVPVAESARHFSMPLTDEHVVPFVVSTPAAHIDEAVQDAQSSLIAEASDPVPAPLTAPFVEAANHISSTWSGKPADSSPDAADFAPFTSKAEHLVPAASDDHASASLSAEVSAPSAEEGLEYASTPVIEEPQLPHQADVFPESSARVETVAEEDAAEPFAEPEPESRPEQPAIEAASHPISPAPAASASDAPWWLSEAAAHRIPNRPPVLWKPARVRMSQQPDEAAELPPIGSGGQAEQRPSWVNTTHSWEPAPSVSELHEGNGGLVGAQKAEQEELAANLSSRLSGLRNLLLVMGVKNAHDAAEPSERPPADASSFDLRSVRQPFGLAALTDRDEVSPISIGGASPRLVTAPPEFLPPQPIAINSGREDAPAGESFARQDRRTAYDGVEILPSRKGQYKKV